MTTTMDAATTMDARPPRGRRRRPALPGILPAFLTALALAVVPSASAGPTGGAGGTGGVPPAPGKPPRPSLSISINDVSNLTDIEGMDPTITWQNSALLPNDVALKYGIDLSARTTNLASLPRRVWGRASRMFSDRFAVSARLDLDVQTPDRVDFEIDGEDEENDLKMRVIGWSPVPTEGKSPMSPPRLAFAELIKSFDNDGNRVTVNPRYNANVGHADVVVTYDADDTTVTVVASRDDQEVTVSQKLNDDNVISPTVGSDGSLSLAWDRKVGEDGGSVRTTLNPNRSVDVEWRDSDWTANVNFPMEDGKDGERGATVRIKRDIKF